MAQYIDSTGRSLPSYQFLKREACLMAMSYSYDLQAQVFDHMSALEGRKEINLMTAPRPSGREAVNDLTHPLRTNKTRALWDMSLRQSSGNRYHSGTAHV